MKTIASLLRDEITQILEAHASKSSTLPAEFPQALIQRVLQYVRQQQAAGRPVSHCAQELGLPQGRLHYWLYQRSRKLAPSAPPVLRPVQVSSELVPVYDGVPERRYVLHSPAGWALRDLRFAELVELLRSLA